MLLDEQFRPAPTGDDTVEALVERVRATRLGVLNWTDRAQTASADESPSPPTHLGDDWPTRRRQDAAGDARRVAGAVPAAGHQPRRPRRPRPGDGADDDAVVGPADAARRARAGDVDHGRRAECRDRLRTRHARPCRFACRTCSARSVHPTIARRRAADNRTALARGSTDPDHQRPARVLVGLVGDGAQGPRRSVSRSITGPPIRRPPRRSD